MLSNSIFFKNMLVNKYFKLMNYKMSLLSLRYIVNCIKLYVVI